MAIRIVAILADRCLRSRTQLETAGGRTFILAGIFSLFSGQYCCILVFTQNSLVYNTGLYTILRVTKYSDAT